MAALGTLPLGTAPLATEVDGDEDSGPIEVEIPLSEIEFIGHEPRAGVIVSVAPAPGELQLTGYEPLVHVSANIMVGVPKRSLGLQTFAPSYIETLAAYREFQAVYSIVEEFTHEALYRIAGEVVREFLTTYNIQEADPVEKEFQAVYRIVFEHEHRAVYGIASEVVEEHESVYRMMEAVEAEHEAVYDLLSYNPVSKEHRAIYSILKSSLIHVNGEIKVII